MSNEFRQEIFAADVRPLNSYVRGRQHQEKRKVRLGDVGPEGRLRLDALARYCQDVSDDDTSDAGLDDSPGWVVRRTVIDVVEAASLAERLTFTTFCSALGRRWAERRLSVKGENGAHYEVATLWICIDPVSGRPSSLTEQFLSIYGEAAAGRKVNARLVHPKPDPSVPVAPWPLRRVDFDVYGHVNNAAYWAVVEEFIDVGPGDRATIEYGSGVGQGKQSVDLAVGHGDLRLLWWVPVEGEIAASASVVPLPPS